MVMRHIAAEIAEGQICSRTDGIEDVSSDEHPESAPDERCGIVLAAVGDTDSHASHEDRSSHCAAEYAVEQKPDTGRKFCSAVHHAVNGHHEYDRRDRGHINTRLPPGVAICFLE